MRRLPVPTIRNSSHPVSPHVGTRRWDKKYWATYKVLDILQKVFYRSNPAREAFVEMCESDYVQKMTFDSYLYKVSGFDVRHRLRWGQRLTCSLSVQQQKHWPQTPQAG